MKMDFEILNTKKERITESVKCTLNLFPEHLKYIIEYKSERRNDDTDEWEPRYIFNHRTIKKASIDNILLFFSNDSDNWYVEIITLAGSDMHASFSTYEKAKELLDKLNKWWFENILPD